MKAIFGLEPLRGGRVFLNGEQIEIRHPRQAIARGIGMINEDRKTTACACTGPSARISLCPTCVYVRRASSSTGGRRKGVPRLLGEPFHQDEQP